MFRDLIFSRLGGLLHPEEIRRWFEPLQWHYDETAGHLRVTAPTVFHVKYLTEKYPAQLADLAAEIGRPKVHRLTLESEDKPKTDMWREMRTAPDPLGTGLIKSDHTFQNYIAGGGNRLALMALDDFAGGRLNLGTKSVFLICPGPWGKTHLLDALARRLAEDPDRCFLKMSAVDFQALPEHGRRHNLSLILDDVHLLAGRPEAQQSLARFLDDLPGGYSGLVCASHRPPQKLAGLADALRSRLSGGLVLPIEPPEYEILMELAARRASEISLDLAPESLSSLARRAESDPRALRGFIDTVGFVAESGGLSGDEAARRLYPDVGPGEREQQIDLDGILTAVSAAFGLKVADLTGHSKLRQAAWPRRVAMYLAKDMTGLTTTKIGEAFGGRDHSTVIHALKKIHQELKNPTQAQLLENIKRSLIISSQ